MRSSTFAAVLLLCVSWLPIYTASASASVEPANEVWFQPGTIAQSAPTTVYLSMLMNPPTTSSRIMAAVTAPTANIRSGPGSLYRILTTVTSDTLLEAIAQNNGWYKVVAPNRMTGWIAGWLVRIDSSVAAELPFAPVIPSTPFPSRDFQATLDHARGRVGAIVYDPVSAVQLYGQHTQQVFPAASIIKVSIGLVVYHQAWRGKIDLNERITMRASDIVGGTGFIQYDPIGTSYTIRDLSIRMLRDSDNTASNLLLKRVGFAAVNELMERIGATQTRVERMFMDFNALQAGRDNYTSPADVLRVLQALEQGDLTGQAGARELLNAMQQTTDRTKLPALLPSDVVIAHKIGTLAGVEHDGGIVYLPGHRYMIVVLTSDLPSSEAGVRAIAEASRVVYTWYTR